MPGSNCILGSLPEADLKQLLASAEQVSLPLGTVLVEPRQPPRYAHFLLSGLNSSINVMATGTDIEVGLTSKEGLPEAIFLLGPVLGDFRCVMQIPGTAWRIEFRTLQRLFAENAILRSAILRYAQLQMLTGTQLTSCNRLHEVEERLARWLLTVCDLIQHPEMKLTQEFIACMLGTRRSSVTIAAAALQRAGLIEYGRGHIRILQPESLRDAACECYTATRRLYLDYVRNMQQPAQ